uniref:Ion_trans domain-containing protein n=1 Tax=Heterorhabditis bacteriophora TaxID=37862 RepID=A0A1I7WIQ2_HETBA
MSLLLCRVSSMAYVGKYAGPNSTPENSSRILEDYLSNRTVNRCLDNWNKYLWGAIVILFLINAIFLIAGKLGTTSKLSTILEADKMRDLQDCLREST